MMSDDVKILAANIASALESALEKGDHSSENFRNLCRKLEGDEPPEEFERFAVLIESEDWRFCDSELIDWWDTESEKISDELRCDYMREVLTLAVDEPTEDTCSAHWEEIPLSPEKSLYCCALIYLEGHSPIINWFGAYLSVKQFYVALTEAGFVTCEEDVAALNNETLLKYWRFDE